MAEWKEFLAFKPEDFLKLKDKTVFDGRNCFNPQAMADVGVDYFCVGRNALKTDGTTTTTTQMKEKINHASI